MKNPFKPAKLGFYVLMLLVFFVVGLYFAGYIEAGKNQGLAGGAIVFGYGVLFGGIALISSFFIAYYLPVKAVVKINIVLFIVLVAAWGYKYYQLSQRDKKNAETEEKFKPKPTSPTSMNDAKNTVKFYKNEISNPLEVESPYNSKTMGMGYFSPNYYENPVLFFYGNPNLEKSITEHLPYDSITFKRNKYNQFEIATAPPWLVPDHLKLDYDMLYFKIESVTQDFIEVVVNTKNGQTSYVSRSAGNISYWPEFLLNVNSVEFAPGSIEKVRQRSFEASGVNNMAYDFMRPLKIKGDWMEVLLLNDNFEKVGKGWIQWQRDGKLLIMYNLLS